MITFLRFIFDIITFSTGIILLTIFYLKKDEDNIENFSEFNLSKETIDTKSLVLPNICNSSIHNITLHLYIFFINNAYYYNTYHPINYVKNY